MIIPSYGKHTLHEVVNVCWHIVVSVDMTVVEDDGEGFSGGVVGEVLDMRGELLHENTLYLKFLSCSSVRISPRLNAASMRFSKSSKYFS